MYALTQHTDVRYAVTTEVQSMNASRLVQCNGETHAD